MEVGEAPSGCSGQVGMASPYTAREWGGWRTLATGADGRRRGFCSKRGT